MTEDPNTRRPWDRVASSFKLREWPKKGWAKWLTISVIAMITVVQELFNTLLGFLILSLAAYAGAEWLFGIRPYTFRQVFDWFMELGADRLLTIIGLIVAYSFALRAWKHQKRVEITLAALAEAATFFNECA